MTLPIRPDAPRLDVVCSGTPAECGTAQGTALRSQIEGCAAALYELEALQLQRPWWLPLRAFIRLADWKAERALRGAVTGMLPSAWERLTAMSAASGVALRRLALINALEPVLSDLSGTVIAGAEAACSAMAVAPQRTPGCGAIVAHNFDYLPLVQPFYAIRDERPRGGLRSLQFIAAPLAGLIDGINEAGLAATYNYAFTMDRAAPAPTISMRLAEVLAACRTTSDAIESLTSRPRWGSGLIMLADAAGDCASLELSPTRSAVRRADANGVVTHANRFREAATCAVQLAASAVHSAHAPRALRGKRVHASSEARDRRFADCTGGDQALGPEAVAALMADHGPGRQPSSDTLCMHSDYWHTTACLQLLPAERRMRIAYAPACAAQYVDFIL